MRVNAGWFRCLAVVLVAGALALATACDGGGSNGGGGSGGSDDTLPGGEDTLAPADAVGADTGGGGGTGAGLKGTGRFKGLDVTWDCLYDGTDDVEEKPVDTFHEKAVAGVNGFYLACTSAATPGGERVSVFLRANWPATAPGPFDLSAATCDELKKLENGDPGATGQWGIGAMTTNLCNEGWTLEAASFVVTAFDASEKMVKAAYSASWTDPGGDESWFDVEVDLDL